MPLLTIVAATQKEIEPVYQLITSEGLAEVNGTFLWKNIHFNFCITGIGVIHSMYSLMDQLNQNSPDGWIQLGIGGAFSPDLTIGKTYLVSTEMAAGLGAEQSDGAYHSPFDLGWEDPTLFPFKDGLLQCSYKPLLSNIPTASGMTTWYAHGFEDTIRRLLQSKHAEIESMEGFPFFYVSLKKGIPFLSLRSISNYVTKRDLSTWQIEKSIDNLNETFISLINENQSNLPSLFRSIG